MRDIQPAVERRDQMEGLRYRVIPGPFGLTRPHISKSGLSDSDVQPFTENDLLAPYLQARAMPPHLRQILPKSGPR